MAAFLCSNSLCPTHHIHRPLVPGIQAAAWGHCWKWPPNRCAFNLFPGHWPLCPKEAASQAGGPKIAGYVCPWLGLSITARPLPPDASLWWLALIGPLGVEKGSWLCPLGLWPLKGPIVTTWKGGSALIPGQPESTSYKEAGGLQRAYHAGSVWLRRAVLFLGPGPFGFRFFFFI